MSTRAVPIQQDETFVMLRLPPTLLSSSAENTGLWNSPKRPGDVSQVKPPPPPCCSKFPPIDALWMITPSACDAMRFPLTESLLVRLGSSAHGLLSGLQPIAAVPPCWTLKLPPTERFEPS